MPGAETLIGRDAELAALVASIEGDRSVVIVGEAGIGKTAIARAAVSVAGRTLYEGGAFATLRELPYLALRRGVDSALAGDAAAVAGIVERIVGPDVLFLDDLQWADDQTLAVVELLAGRILLLGAIRALDAGAEHALAVVRQAGLDAYSLGPLPALAAREIVDRRRPGLASRVVDDIVRRGAGNPLLLEEMATHGAGPDVLTRVLAGRLALLPPNARRVVELLAIAEQPLPRAALGCGVEETLRHGMAVETERGLEVRHQLVADAIREGLDVDTRRRRHEGVAAILDGRPEAARHLAAAGRRAEAAAAAIRALDASGDARERAALLVIAAEASEPAAGTELRLRAGRALDEVSEWPAIVRVLGDLGPPATPEQVAEAQAILAHATFSLGDVDACRGHVTAMDATAIPPASAAAIRVAIESATFLVNAEGAVEAAVARLDAAVAAMPARHPGAVDLGVLRACILILATGAGDPDAIRAAADDAFEAGRYRTATDRARVIQYFLNMGVSSEAALAFLLDRYARYDAAGIGSLAQEFLADAVAAATLSGAFEQAVSIADGLLEQPASARARQAAEIHRAQALVYLGRIDEAERALEALRPSVSPDFFGLGDTLRALAEAALWGGQPDAALELAERALAVPAPIPNALVPAMLVRAWACRDLDLQQPHVEDVPPSPSLAGAPIELGALALSASGDETTAAIRFDAAAAAWSRFNTPRALVCRWAAAESRRRAAVDQGRDAEGRAIAELRSALAACEAARFEPLSARVRRSLRLAGVRVAARPARRRGSGLGLTAREEELVSLVERGLTNVEIARRLGLGRPTVARILASAMTKVGVSRRTGLVGAAGTASRRPSPAASRPPATGWR